jgi:ABC-type transport system involved in cytochrome bd biosynthesis fused ATPase/permease subunit
METILIGAAALIILYVIFRIFKAILKWVIILIVVVLALAYFTNPDESTHRENLKNKAKELSVKIRQKLVAVDDYKIFSLIKVKVDGEEKIVGIGAFGQVWYFDDLKQRLKKK